RNRARFLPARKTGSIRRSLFSPCGRKTVLAHSSYGFLVPLPLALGKERGQSSMGFLTQALASVAAGGFVSPLGSPAAFGAGIRFAVARE
ncbi:MAG: hypothetical protein WBC70_02175, partial [Candidatus Aminicenantales bacterium]